MTPSPQSYGPLFPFAQYTLLTSLLISLSCYMAIGVVVIVFVFPETLNHATLTSAITLLEKIEGLVKLQEEVLSVGTHLDSTETEKEPTQEALLEAFADGAPLLAKLAGARDAMIGAAKGCELNSILSVYAKVYGTC